MCVVVRKACPPRPISKRCQGQFLLSGTSSGSGTRHLFNGRGSVQLQWTTACRVGLMQARAVILLQWRSSEINSQVRCQPQQDRTPPSSAADVPDNPTRLPAVDRPRGFDQCHQVHLRERNSSDCSTQGRTRRCCFKPLGGRRQVTYGPMTSAHAREPTLRDD